MDNQEFLHIFEEAPIPMCVVDAASPNFILLKVNHAYTNKSLRRANTLIGKPFFDAFPANPKVPAPNGPERLKNSFQQVIATKKKDEIYGLRYDLADDEGRFIKYFWKIINTPIFDEQGAVKHIINSAIDITGEFLNDWENRIMLDNTVEAFMIVDTDLKIINYNAVLEKSFAEIFGRKVTTGTYILDFVEPSRKNMVEADYRKALKGEMVQTSLTFKSFDGASQYIIDATHKPVFDTSGEIIGVFVSMRNVTEEHEAEEKLRNVVEHSTNMFYTHNPDGVLTYVSPQSIHFLGCKPEEAKRRWTEFVTDHPQNQLGIQLTQKTIATGEIQQAYELQLKTADNRVIWVEVNEAPLLENGKTKAVIGSLTDITERKKYETQLKESIERYDYVTKATRDAIYDWDIKANKVIWGEGLKSLFGYDPQSFNEIKNAWDKHIHSNDFKEFRLKLNQALENKSKQRWVHEYRFKKGDGVYTYVSENGYIIRDNAGKALRMIGTIQDVSEAVAAKKEIQDSLAEKETLLSEIHHRVKNNLAVVSGMMQLQAFEEEDTQLQAKLFDSVSRIKTMATVHELLYQSRSFSKLEFSDTVQKLVQNISQTLQTDPNIRMETKCESIKLNISQAIPASLIINEVLTNTYKHAFNGRADGTITFHLHKKGEQIFIQIKDDGVGFPPNFNPESSNSLGFHLIKVLSEQIQASYTYKNNETGTLFDLSFTKTLSK